jgi:hypothetical protein
MPWSIRFSMMSPPTLPNNGGWLQSASSLTTAISSFYPVRAATPKSFPNGFPSTNASAGNSEARAQPVFIDSGVLRQTCKTSDKSGGAGAPRPMQPDRKINLLHSAQGIRQTWIAKASRKIEVAISLHELIPMVQTPSAKPLQLVVPSEVALQVTPQQFAALAGRIGS